MSITSKLTGNLTTPYAARLIGDVAREHYTRLADDTLLPALRRDLPGHFGKTVKKQIAGRGLATQMAIGSADPAIKYIEEGRDTGKPPPIRALLKWVKKKMLGVKAQSAKTRRPLTVGIERSRDRKTGKLRTRGQSLAARQKSIAYAISRDIAREGLPRKTGFPPSHALFLFRDLKQTHAQAINAMTLSMEGRIASVLKA